MLASQFAFNNLSYLPRPKATQFAVKRPIHPDRKKQNRAGLLSQGGAHRSGAGNAAPTAAPLFHLPTSHCCSSASPARPPAGRQRAAAGPPPAHVAPAGPAWRGGGQQRAAATEGAAGRMLHGHRPAVSGRCLQGPCCATPMPCGGPGCTLPCATHPGADIPCPPPPGRSPPTHTRVHSPPLPTRVVHAGLVPGGPRLGWAQQVQRLRQGAGGSCRRPGANSGRPEGLYTAGSRGAVQGGWEGGCCSPVSVAILSCP